ncbi:hypothetical protein BDD12DRAFT_408280 [Trichophaea hybrida]|nr:hypothetical protein BDD12DRAFT_408280 [Trichophaea hybrida]
MENTHITTLVHSLDDIELAILLCLVADKHCILTTESGGVEKLELEVDVIGTQVFGLLTVIVQCTPDITLDEFVTALLVSEEVPEIGPAEPFVKLRGTTTTDPFTSGRKRIANVVILRDLDKASLQVQTLVLELMRTRQVLTSRSVLEVPERFLVIALIPKTYSLPALFRHLREQFFISHHHSSLPEEEEQQEVVQSDADSLADSLASVVIRKYSPSIPPPQISSFPFNTLGRTYVPHAIVDSIRALVADVSISTEIGRYVLDIVVFLRMHRAVKGGVSTQGTVDFELLVKCLAPLHGLDFVTPALASLAVFKVYSHRIELVQRVEDERSIMWGSSPEAVELYLKQVDVEAVIEDVLARVRAPL